MNRQELQVAFQKPYQQGAWLDLLRAVLPGTDIFGNPQPIEVEHKVARRVAQLGSVRLNGGRQLAVLEIEVGDRIDVVRNRVGLRNFVARFIDQERAHGVLAIFLSPEQDYRFTFAAKESAFADDGTLTSKETAPRRYTYVLGPNEPCRTPAERFAELAAKAHDATLDDVIAAFSVEKLNKEFFTDFCRAFDFVCDDLRKQHKWPDAVLKAEAQTLLNRLLFLYFVQRKGWLNRERTFLVSNFRRHYQQSAKGITFFTKFLQPLFERLSTEDLPQALSELDVPFLNGGLFNDEYAEEQSDEAARRRRNLRIGNETFHEIFENLLERYNFTIQEDSPSHFEVAIDPEMLGRIFEELVLRGEESESGGKSARHDTGSHYTPRPIVHYLCRESLAGWLESQPPFVDKPEARKRINTLLALDASEGIDEETKKTLHDLLTPDEAAALRERLLELRACDPAVGSGAFPIGLLHELLNLLRLAETRARGQDPVEGDRDWLYENKKRIIEKVIYGVDLQGRATEICKLRLWLSLMVDHDLGVDPFDCEARAYRSALKKLEPLPNLDFKIRRANSLRDTIHGEPVRLFGGGHDLSSTDMAVTINRLISAKHDFYAARKAAEKRRTRLDIYDCLFQLAEHHLNQLVNDARGLLLDEGDEGKVAEVHRLKQALKEVGGIRTQIREARRAKAAVQTEALERLQGYLDEDQKPTFVWELDFAEVFFIDRDQKTKGQSLLPNDSTGKRAVVQRHGFDLMLGNPPYIRLQTLKKDSPELVEFYKQRYHSASKGNYDLYVCFVERGIELLHEQGQLGYILPHKFFNAQYGEPLREIISGRYESRVNVLRHVVHFGDQQIFPGATNYVCLLFLAKAGAKSGCRFVQTDNLKRWLHSLQGNEGIISARDIKEDEWNFVVGRGSDLFERLKNMPVKLDQIADLFVGLQTSADTVFLFKDSKSSSGKITRLHSKELDEEVELETALLKPVLRSGEVGSYWARPSALVLFPYHQTAGGYELIPEKEFNRSYPMAWEYLRRNRTLLESREHGKFKETGWYQLYPKNLDLWDQPKVMIPYMITKLSAFIAQDSMYFVNVTTGGFGATLTTNSTSLPYLTALLNAPVLDWFFKRVSTTFHGGYFAANKQFLVQLPIRTLDFNDSNETARHDTIVCLVQWLLWLHAQPSVAESTREHPRDPLIAAYFEQWVNALVYELYFPAELHAAGLHFFDLTAQHTLPPLSEWEEKTERLPKIRERYEKLSAGGHALRVALEKLQTLDLVRIIEGKP
jgi:hypothetical protein